MYGYFTEGNDSSELADPALFSTEIIFAVTLGLTFLARFLWMQCVNGSTPSQSHASQWEHVLSKLAHYGIYAGVVAIVFSGLAIAFGYAMLSP